MPEEQGDAMEVPGVSQPEGNPLIGESHLGKVAGLQTLEYLLLLLCLYRFAAALLLWYLAWCDWIERSLLPVI